MTWVSNDLKEGFDVAAQWAFTRTSTWALQGAFVLAKKHTCVVANKEKEAHLYCGQKK